jgi:demethylmenaquinone methyltransferase/2-methoxy-6-polyprenyl-1,4-benzoquinol methylase
MEQCLPPSVVMAALKDAGFSEVRRSVKLALLSEYTARR